MMVMFKWYMLMCLFFTKVCDDRHSELIPCLDRNLIYQMRLKLDLSLMEHYERHCPPPERRFNCLIPPPPGYKVCYFSSFVDMISVLTYFEVFFYVNVSRFQSSGRKAETKFGK